MASLTADQMIRALAVGMFPMAPTRDSASVDWIEPKMRTILPLDGFHLSHSLTQRLRSDRFTVTVDQGFAEVVAGCAEITSDRIDTWISPALKAVLAELHQRGLAHSVECWRGDKLAGGLFGVAAGGLFAAESMFTREPDASKVAFAHLMVRLREGGYRLVDCQFMTSHLRSLGAVEIEQRAYRQHLVQALEAGGVSPGSPLKPAKPSAVDFFASGRAPLSGRYVINALTSGPGAP